MNVMKPQDLLYQIVRYSNIAYKSYLGTTAYPLEFYPPRLSNSNIGALDNGIRCLSALLVKVL